MRNGTSVDLMSRILWLSLGGFPFFPSQHRFYSEIRKEKEEKNGYFHKPHAEVIDHVEVTFPNVEPFGICLEHPSRSNQIQKEPQ